MATIARYVKIVCVLVVALEGFAAAADRPNVLVILTDDQGWGDLSMNGNTNLSTPNIDQLAKEGAVFDRFYVCPVCSPTRAEFLTGRYHPRGGVYSTSAGGERLDLDEVTIAETFRASGYRTAAFGKWHNGMQYPYHPNGRGFDEFYGFCSGHWGNYWNPMLEHNGEIVAGKGFIIDDLTDHAMKVIEQKSDQPFFVYVPYNTPHSPMQVPDRWWNRFKDAELKLHNVNNEGKEDLDHIKAALAMCENIDWNVGRLMESLNTSGKTDNTIVVYFSDNGPNGTRWNGGMKGRKGSTDEGGVRSPCIVRWPSAVKPGQRISINAAAIDLHPTLAAMANISAVNKQPFDGNDLAPLIMNDGIFNGNAWPIEERMIMSHWNGKVSIKKGRLRLANDGKLYDVEADPGQQHDVSNKNAVDYKRMNTVLGYYKEQVLPGYDDDRRPFVIAHPDSQNTQIPARDGKGHGGIKRSNRFPNSSYFTNWKSTEDSITWDAEVLTSGVYEVEMFYTCPAGDEGSTVELSFNDSRLSGTILKAAPAVIIGPEEDRVKRSESYEQNWSRQILGDIKLTAGPGTLTLAATKISRTTVMDFRLMKLRRK